MSDIVERIRRPARTIVKVFPNAASAKLMMEAADHIAALEARNARLEEQVAGAKAKGRDEGIELCAFAAEGLATVTRQSAIIGRLDPLEAQLLDEKLSELASDLRRQKSARTLTTEQTNG